jgi:hypothetical protein
MQYPKSSDAPQLGVPVTWPGWAACQRWRASSRAAVDGEASVMLDGT